MKPAAILRAFRLALARHGRTSTRPERDPRGRFLRSDVSAIYAEVAQECGCSVRTVRRAVGRRYRFR